YFAFGRHLDELNVTWAHLEKKQMRLQTNTKTLEDLCSQSLERASQAIHDAALENQLLSASLLICLGKRDCVERIPSGALPRYTQIDIDHAAGGNLRVLSVEEAWETIEDYALYDEPIRYLNTMEDKADNLRNTHRPSKEIPSIDEPEPQPNPLPNCLSLDVSLGEERGPEPPIKPHSPNSFRMKEVDSLTINTSPSPHVASSHPKDTYCYYRPCIDDPKKHYGFKPGLLGKSASLGVDISNWEMFDDD
ncbi:hypothetical protein Tco_1083818, partial [Tanacetum coccineum]